MRFSTIFFRVWEKSCKKLLEDFISNLKFIVNSPFLAVFFCCFSNALIENSYIVSRKYENRIYVRVNRTNTKFHLFFTGKTFYLPSWIRSESRLCHRLYIYTIFYFRVNDKKRSRMVVNVLVVSTNSKISTYFRIAYTLSLFLSFSSHLCLCTTLKVFFSLKMADRIADQTAVLRTCVCLSTWALRSRIS